MNKKIACSLDSPYTSPSWPVISSNDEADIVDLLCRLLEPIGNHRREHIKASKGGSSRKRKRKASQEVASTTDPAPKPPTPAVSSHITLGFRSTIRHLESLSATSRPRSLGGANPEQSEDAAGGYHELLAPLSVVFVHRTGLPPILTSSLPLLAATASLAHPQEAPIRLVQLDNMAADKLAKALCQPRVGCVGLQSDAPTAENLIALVRDRVQPVDVPWLREASSAAYLPVKVRQTEVKIGPRKEKAVYSIPDKDGPK